MKSIIVKNNWCNLTQVKVESPGILQAFKLVRYPKGRIFRLDNELEETDQIIINNDDEYYIITDLSKEIDEVPGEPVEYMSLNDYCIHEFHAILDNENLDWLEKRINKINRILEKIYK